MRLCIALLPLPITNNAHVTFLGFRPKSSTYFLQVIGCAIVHRTLTSSYHKQCARHFFRFPAEIINVLSSSDRLCDCASHSLLFLSQIMHTNISSVVIDWAYSQGDSGHVTFINLRPAHQHTLKMIDGAIVHRTPTTIIMHVTFQISGRHTSILLRW